MNKYAQQEKWRMEGALWALKIAKEKSVDQLEQDLKRRGFLKLNIFISQEELEKAWDTLRDRICNTMKLSVLWTLHRDFKWGDIRLHRFIEALNVQVKRMITIDKYGQSYVTFQDIANTLKEECNVDTECEEEIKQVDDLNTAYNQQYVQLNIVKDVLKKHDMNDAISVLDEAIKKGRGVL